MKKHALVLAAALVAGGIAVGGIAVAAPESPCRGDENETRLGYDASNPVQNELPTIYTDGEHYVGVCGGTTGEPGHGYVEARNIGSGYADGAPIVTGQSGNESLDTILNGPTSEYGPSTIGIASPADGEYGCAPEGTTQYGYWRGNAVQRELPTVYTDGFNQMVGVCGGSGGYIQLNTLMDAINGDKPLIEGQSGIETIDAQIWGDGENSYGPATVWLEGGGSESPNPTCARDESDTRLVHQNGNAITRELPTVYTNTNNYVGICGGGGRLEINNPGNFDPEHPENTVIIEGLPALP